MGKYLITRSAAFLLLIFSTLNYNSAQNDDGTLTSITKFDDYLELLNATTTYKGRLRLVEAVWGQIRADRANDFLAIAELYALLPNFPNAVSITSNNEEGLELELQQQAADELKQAMRRHLVLGNAKLLAEALTGPAYYASPMVADFCNSLLSNYDYALVKTVYEVAIDEVYNFIPTEVLAAHLVSIYQENTAQSFELMLESQLYLFWRFTNNRNVNDIYVFNFGYYLYKWQNVACYQNLNRRLQREINSAIAQLPSSVQNLLFLSSTMFVNVNTEEPLYTTDASFLNKDTRATYLWTSKDIIDHSFPFNHTITETLEISDPGFQAQTHLKFQFISTMFKIYLYRNSENVVGAWPPVGVPPPTNGYWHVIYHEDILIIKQDDYAMCAGDLVNKARRYVIALQASSGQANKNCQWTAHKFALTK